MNPNPSPVCRSCPTVSIVFSFYNEQPVLPELLRRVRAILRDQLKQRLSRGYELIFVNDASTDASRTFLTLDAEREGDIVLLNMSRNFGVSACVLAGMAHSSGDVVIYMDSDLQDPPEVIPALLDAYRADPVLEVVHTIREKRRGERRVKLLVTRLGYAILRKFATIDLQIEAGDFKLVSRLAKEHLLALHEKRPYMRGLVSWIGFKQESVRYTRDARFAGDAKFPIFSIAVVRNFLSSALISFSDLPLQVSSLIGVFLSLVALLYALGIVVCTICGVFVQPWSYVLLAVMFFSGIQLLSIGILGLYIAAIHLESKRRPNYILESVVGKGLQAELTCAPKKCT